MNDVNLASEIGIWMVVIGISGWAVNTVYLNWKYKCRVKGCRNKVSKLVTYCEECQDIMFSNNDESPEHDPRELDTGE